MAESELELIPARAMPDDPRLLAPVGRSAAQFFAPYLTDYLARPQATPLGAFPSEATKLPPEWQSSSALDALPAATDVAGLLGGLPKGAAGLALKGAIFVTPGSPLLRGALKGLPRNPELRETILENVNKLRAAVGGEPATAPTVGLGDFAGTGSIPRVEIQDVGARLVPGEKEGEWLWQHPAGDLHKIYDVPPIKFDPRLPAGNARMSPSTRQITLGGDPRNAETLQLASNDVAHEFQHVIQEKEKLPIGGTLNTAANYPEYWEATGRKFPTGWGADRRIQQEKFNLNDHLKLYYDTGFKSPTFEKAFDVYERLAGETEARNVARRLERPELYEKRPYETEDYPRSRQFLRFSPDNSANAAMEKLRLVPSAPEGVHLQPAAGMRDMHDYFIHNDTGTRVGEVTLNVQDPKNLYVEWIGRLANEDRRVRPAGSEDLRKSSSANTLGPKEIRSLLDSIREHYPEAETISGFRAGGARYFGKPDKWSPEGAALGYEPVIRLRGGRPPVFE